MTSLNGHLVILSGLGDAAVFDAMVATRGLRRSILDGRPAYRIMHATQTRRQR